MWQNICIRKVFESSFQKCSWKNQGLQCEHCEKSFSTNYSLNSHKRIHSEIRERIKCFECDKTFASVMNLKVHVKSVHEKLKDHQCEHCEKSFSSSSMLIKHRKIHSNFRERIKCISKCEKTCVSKDTLKIHMQMIHDKIKNYKCENCDQSYFAKADLKKHIKANHDGQKVKRTKKKVMKA